MGPQLMWVALVTIVRKEIRRFMRIWPQTLVPPIITTSLYFMIFGNLIGERIGEMNGHRYMDYIAPGLIMMSVITSSYSNVTSSFFGARFQRHVEEMLVSPMPSFIIVLGYVCGGVARGLFVGLGVTLVAMFFARAQVNNVALTVLVVVLTATLFALAGFINALFARSFDDISIVPTFVLTPLTYLGGVFYSISLLSELWQTVSLLNPVLYMVNAFRFGVLGVSDIPVWVALIMVVACVTTLFVAAVRLLHRGVGVRG
jgi:ABC-2 type transport system permease protein